MSWLSEMVLLYNGYVRLCFVWWMCWRILRVLWILIKRGACWQRLLRCVIACLFDRLICVLVLLNLK